MKLAQLRIAVGLVAVLLVTSFFAGAVATSAVVSHGYTDAGSCAPGGDGGDSTGLSSETLAERAGELIDCALGVRTTDASGGPPMR